MAISYKFSYALVDELISRIERGDRKEELIAYFGGKVESLILHVSSERISDFIQRCLMLLYGENEKERRLDLARLMIGGAVKEVEIPEKVRQKFTCILLDSYAVICSEPCDDMWKP